MPKIFTDQDKEILRKKLLEKGFCMLKQQGLTKLKVEDVARECFIAKGTFYGFFESKSEFLYQISLHERQRSKDMLRAYLNSSGKLTADGLYHYLCWLWRENPNIFAYMTEVEKKRLMQQWPPEYIENESNDERTMRMLIEMLEAPKEKPDWKCACNLMKMAAASLVVREMFIEDAFEDTLHCLFRNVILCITDQQFGKGAGLRTICKNACVTTGAFDPAQTGMSGCWK